jgi:porphobilinogen synthase
MKLIKRLSRLRGSQALRALIRESRLELEDVVLPIFVSEGFEKIAVASMPGVFQLPESDALIEAREAYMLGIKAVIIFGIPNSKDEIGTSGFSDDAIVQRFTKTLKREIPDLLVITDVCLCEYTSHGHCGLIHDRGGKRVVDNDSSVEILAKIAVSHARAGADIVAPSDMMDGRIGSIRTALDESGFSDTPIMSYAAKFASAFYSPFRDAAGSVPSFGDRKTYQMDPANGREALREVEQDVEEGADIVMVKPGLAYLDVLWRVKEKFGLPTAAYCVSGEYAMVKAAAANQWIDERACVMEMMTAFKRAGADIIITYWAKDIARWISGDSK